jgi:hypothetical protein
MQLYPWIAVALSTLLSLTSRQLTADELEFDSLYRSPYYLGRGDTGVAVADGHEALFYNPAGLATGKGVYKEIVLVSPSIQSSLKTKDIVRQTIVEEDNSPETFKSFLGRNMHFSLSNFSGIILRRAAVGLLVSSSTNLLLAKTKEDRGVEGLKAEAAANRVFTFGLAESILSDRLQIGSTFKYLSRNEARLAVSALDTENIADRLTADGVGIERSGFGFDLGLMYSFTKIPWRLGLHVENAGTTLLRAGEKDASERRLPQIVTAGVAFQKNTNMSSMLFLIDFRDLAGGTEKDFLKRLHIGTELSFAKVFGFVGGLNQGYPTAGVYLDLLVLRADIGVYTQEVASSVGLRPDQRLYFRLTGGF